MAASDPLHLVGATLGRKYVVDSLVRVEEAAVVYRATQVGTNRSMGVRVLAAITSLPEERRKSLTEGLARVQATLSELAEIIPAAYPIRDVGSVATPHGNAPFVALDWPHGITLRQMVQPEAHAGAALPDSIEAVVAMLEPVAVAIAIAHENGVVHGGITPDRVLFREELQRADDRRGDAESGGRRVTLLDFGVAAVLRAIDGGTEPVPADDVRALAAILAQAMARACGADARLDEARTPKERGVVVTSEVEAVFARALGAETYPSVGELWSALRRALGLTSLRSLEATIPPESRPIASASLHPLAHSTAPVTARPLWEPVLYAVGTFVVLVLGGLTIQRGRDTRSAHRDRDAHGIVPSAAAAGAATTRAGGAGSCEPGMIPAGGGSVHLGTEGDQDDPARDVTLTAFCIDRDAVSTSAYKACSDRGDCAPASRTNEWEGIGPDDHEVLDPFCSARDPSPSSRPVNCVTWEMAENFCAKRGGRLPTETEWELASRSTAASVAEWMSDWRAPLAAGPAENPTGPSGGDEHVVRGAHAIGAAATRFGAAPATKSHAIGFRCVKTL